MARKTHLNVYQATLNRIEYLFNEFDNIIVSFSGGKDSGVLLNIAYDYAKQTNQLNKLSVVHLDYEAQYQETTDYVTQTFESLSDVKRFWLCIPIHAQCACNMNQHYWTPWNKSEKDLWVRPMPTYDYVINEDNMKFTIKSMDCEIPDNFFKWFNSVYGDNTIDLVGIRTQESLTRYAALNGKRKIRLYKGINWIVGGNAYPIYDWKTRDIWIYNAKFNKPYNKIYDLYYRAGLTIEQMRVASPFNDCAISTLSLYKVLDPNTWGKMIGRVNGVNFSAIYGGTTAMGWQQITKPSHFTWKEYCYFLLSTLDHKTREHYLSILERSIQYWCEKGGNVAEELLDELKTFKYEHLGTTDKFNYRYHILKFDEYPDDYQGKVFNKIPSYKRLCVCIMKNDYYCKYMGFGPTKDAIIKRKATLEKYRSL